MGAALDDAAVVENHDRVGVLHGRQAVGNDEDRAALHQCVHAALHQKLRARVDGAGRFVKDHDGRVGDRRAGDGQQLALTLREICAVGREHGVIAVRQAGDEIVRVGELCRRNAFLVRRIELAVADIVHDRAGKEVHVLQDNTE